LERLPPRKCIGSIVRFDLRHLVEYLRRPGFHYTGRARLAADRANGDGKADIIQGFTATTSSVNINTYSTTTSVYSWTASSSYSGYVPIFAYNGGQVSTGLFGNFNGDSLPDYVQSTPSYSDSYLGNGSAWNITTYFDGPKQFPSPGSSEPASQLIDLNSDGLDDWVYSEGNKIYALMNNGTGWNSSPSPQWTISTSKLYDDPSSSNYNDRGIRFMDLNGDGFPDFVRSYQIQSGCSGMEIADYKAVYLNTGNGWATSTAYTLPAYITYCDGSTVTHNEYANFNGNGQMKQDVLTKVTNTKGGTVTVDYSIPSITLNPELAFPLLTVNTIATGDGLGNYSTTTYQYAEGRMYLTSGPRDRKFAGFAIATTTNPDSIVATYYNQGYGLNSERGEQSDGFGQINKPYRRDILDSSGNKKQRTFYRWDTATSGNSTFVGLGREMTWDFASDGSHRDKATDYRYASSTGDLIQKTEYGEVNGSADGTFNYRFWVR